MNVGDNSGKLSLITISKAALVSFSLLMGTWFLAYKAFEFVMKKPLESGSCVGFGGFYCLIPYLLIFFPTGMILFFIINGSFFKKNNIPHSIGLPLYAIFFMFTLGGIITPLLKKFIADSGSIFIIERTFTDFLCFQIAFLIFYKLIISNNTRERFWSWVLAYAIQLVLLIGSVMVTNYVYPR